MLLYYSQHLHFHIPFHFCVIIIVSTQYANIFQFYYDVKENIHVPTFIFSIYTK